MFSIFARFNAFQIAAAAMAIIAASGVLVAIVKQRRARRASINPDGAHEPPSPANPGTESPGRPSAHDLVMTYRPLSQFLRLMVSKEIEKRLNDGRLTAGSLPLHIQTVRLVMGKEGRVEINDEVQLEIEVKPRRLLAPGERITLADVDPAECYLKPPTIDGQRAAFYLARCLYLSFFTAFDFTPNAPGGPTGMKMLFPIGGVVAAQQHEALIQPNRQFAILRDKRWPPGTQYYPSILLALSRGTIEPDSPQFAEAVAKAYSPDYWTVQLQFWKEIDAFPSRLDYVRKAVQEYEEGDYISAVRVITPEIEGIIREHLTRSGYTPAAGQRACLRQFRTLVQSRQLRMFSVELLDLILGSVDTDFMKHTDQVVDPAVEANRHGVAHSIFAGYENRDLALKYLVLFDALAFLIFHDRLVTGTL